MFWDILLVPSARAEKSKKSWILWSWKMGWIACPVTSARNCHVAKHAIRVQMSPMLWQKHDIMHGFLLFFMTIGLSKNLFLMFRRPSGSELNVPSTGVADEMKSTHPDHIGGYQVALPIFAGIESKFGLCLPKFQVVSSENMKKWQSAILSV